MQNTKSKIKSIVTLAASLLFAFLCALPPGSIHAIEVPLEGFGKATTIAYVNMHKVFESFPETEQARVELNQLIEEKKAEVTAKKEEIAQLKGQIEFLRKQMSAVVPSTSPRTTEPEEKEKTEKSDQTAPTPGTGLTLPEGSPLGFIFSPPEKSTETAPVEVSTGVPVVSISTAAPKILPGIPSPEPQLKEKEALLSQKEAELETFIGIQEEEIERMEEGKTMTLMARIYKVLEDVGKKKGYSIILDKANILYGEGGTVDITDDVIFRLTVRKSK